MRFCYPVFHVPLLGISVCSHSKYIIFLSWLVGALGVLHSKELQSGLRQSVTCSQLYTSAYALFSILSYTWTSIFLHVSVIILHACGAVGTKEILLHQSHMYIDISFGTAILSLKNVGGWSLCRTDSTFVCVCWCTYMIERTMLGVNNIKCSNGLYVRLGFHFSSIIMLITLCIRSVLKRERTLCV
jgi:hypothetical protein